MILSDFPTSFAYPVKIIGLSTVYAHNKIKLIIIIYPRKQNFYIYSRIYTERIKTAIVRS